MSKLQKQKLMIDHNLTIRENIRTGQVEAKLVLGDKGLEEGQKTEGQYLATMLYWLVTEHPEKVSELYKEFSQYLQTVVVEKSEEVIH